jgi:hypothetical protein
MPSIYIDAINRYQKQWGSYNKIRKLIQGIVIK